MKNSVKEALRRIDFLERAFCIYWLARPRVVYHNIPYWFRGAEDGLPIPPLRLRSLVWGEYVDLRNFFKEQGQLDYLLDVLAGDGANVEEFRAILDFGCGAGRALRQVPYLRRSLGKATFHGTDINPKQIDWCKRNLPFAQFEANRATPPLAYSNEQFNFIYTFSVFTHLSEAQQFAWMGELSRVVKPGGYLLITTCGDSYFETLSENEKAQFRQDQLVVRHQELAGIPRSYADCIAFHPVSYVREKLTKGFELIHFSPGIASRSGPKGEMDHFFLRKPPTAAR
jgi:SAM-dependent methyltransferase